MNASFWYVDTSALVKLVVQERESGVLKRWLLDKNRLATSDLTRVEAPRAIRLAEAGALGRLEESFDTLDFIHLDYSIYNLAARLEPPRLRTLDAIHLATALSLGVDLMGVVTYDARMAAAARSIGLSVESPGL